MKLLNNLERLNPDELEIIVKFLLLPRWCKDVDLLICMKTTIQSALDREFTDLLTRKPGSIMNQEVLSKYLEAEEQVLTNYLPQHTKIVHIDTTNLKTFLGVEIITRSVLIELKELSDEEITFIPINILREKLDFVGFESNKELLKMLIKQILIHPQHLKRSIVESDQTKVQIVVCTIIKCGTNILLFKKKEISADQRFNDKHMIWIGGHLRKDDYIDMSPPNVEKAFKSCLRRELEEEINYCGNAELEFKGLVYDKTNFRSLQHLAVVYIMNIKDISVMQSLHKKTFRELAGQQLEAEFIDLSEQNSFFNVQSVEPWSCDMLQSLFNISIHPSKREQQLLLLL
jgi:predicted NUDIX family phosphoesterase